MDTFHSLGCLDSFSICKEIWKNYEKTQINNYERPFGQAMPTGRLCYRVLITAIILCSFEVWWWFLRCLDQEQREKSWQKCAAEIFYLRLAHFMCYEKQNSFLDFRLSLITLINLALMVLESGYYSLLCCTFLPLK